MDNYNQIYNLEDIYTNLSSLFNPFKRNESTIQISENKPGKDDNLSNSKTNTYCNVKRNRVQQKKFAKKNISSNEDINKRKKFTINISTKTIPKNNEKEESDKDSSSYFQDLLVKDNNIIQCEINNNINKGCPQNIINHHFSLNNEQQETRGETKKVELIELKREDNEIIKIKKWFYNMFLSKINSTIKDDYKIKAEIPEIINSIACKDNLGLMEKKMKDIVNWDEIQKELIAEYHLKEINEIFKSDQSKQEALDLLNNSFKDFMENNWEQFSKDESTKQKNKYEKNECRKIIQKLIKEKNIEELKKVEKYIYFEDKTKNAKMFKVHKNEDIIEKFENYYIKINKNSVKKLSYLFEINLTCEQSIIDSHINSLKNLANNMEKWFKKRAKNKDKSGS